jgi:hypothetical protein
MVLFCKATIAQQISLSTEKSNFLYVGVVNPVKVIVENSNCNLIALKCDSCELRKIGTCSFNVIPKKLGKLNISVVSIENELSTVIGVFSFDVVYPYPILNINKRNNGDSITLQEIVSQLELIVSSRFGLHPKLISYNMIFFRNNEFLREFRSINPLASEEFRQYILKNARNGDKILLHNIFISQEGGTILINPIELILKDDNVKFQSR